MFMTAAYAAGGVVALGALAPKLKARLELSRAKYRSLAGHARMSRRVAALIPFYEYDEDRFFHADNAPAEIAAQRRNGFHVPVTTLPRIVMIFLQCALPAR